MRRLVLEIDAAEISGFIKESPEWIEKIKSLEVLSFLGETPKESAMICRVTFKDSASSIEDVFAVKGMESQTLEKERNGMYICFIKKKYEQDPTHVGLLGTGAYLSTPYEPHDGKVKATFLGIAIQIRKLLRLIEKTAV